MQTALIKSHIVRLLSLANQSASSSTIVGSLVEANQLLGQLDAADNQFTDAAFRINVDLLKSLDRGVVTNFNQINADINSLASQVQTISTTTDSSAIGSVMAAH